MKNVIIETATDRFENFLSENQEQVRHSKTLYIITMHITSSPVFEKYLGEKEGLDDSELKNLQDSAQVELQKLIVAGEVITAPINYLDAIGIRSLNYITVVCGLSFDMNYRFLREVLLRAKELEPKMAVDLERKFKKYSMKMKV